ncbi:MAG: 50S ribosomal protein L25 [Deltaproteobacteria bacterium]|nr:50S ribosomal protein L25 [Deltaproteobacteria bacterium]MDQ3295205.1 50S ribosomal protein L25 [Myxococcota bacterium]
MEVGKLTVTLREKTGHKGAARQLRATGKVPGVCYGASVDGRIEPLSIIVEVKALRAALDPVRKHNTVINLTIEGGTAPRSLHALVKDYQIDPVRRDIRHVDLIAVDPNKEVTSTVPLEFTGKPKGTIDGGQLRIVMRNLEVRAKPADIPIKVNVDVSPLGIGDVVHVSTLTLPPGVTSITGRDLAVATCAAPEEDKTPVVEGVPAEGAAAAAGAAPAAAGAKDAKDAKAPAGGKDAKAPAGKAAPAAAAKPAKK